MIFGVIFDDFGKVQGKAMTGPKRPQERHKASPRQPMTGPRQMHEDHRWAKTAQDSSKTPVKRARTNFKKGSNKLTTA